MTHDEKALAAVEEHGLSAFQHCTASELKTVLTGVNKELRVLQEQMKKLKTERHILEMLLYVMYPQEAKETYGLGHYHGASHMVAIRLSQVRGDRKNIARGTCFVEGCELDVLAKGMCEQHYHENRSGNLAAPRSDVDEDAEALAKERSALLKAEHSYKKR